MKSPKYWASNIRNTSRGFLIATATRQKVEPSPMDFQGELQNHFLSLKSGLYPRNFAGISEASRFAA